MASLLLCLPCAGVVREALPPWLHIPTSGRDHNIQTGSSEFSRATALAGRSVHFRRWPGWRQWSQRSTTARRSMRSSRQKNIGMGPIMLFQRGEKKGFPSAVYIHFRESIHKNRQISKHLWSFPWTTHLPPSNPCFCLGAHRQTAGWLSQWMAAQMGNNVASSLSKPTPKSIDTTNAFFFQIFSRN